MMPIDQKSLEALCEELEGFLDGRTSIERCRTIAEIIGSRFRFAAEDVVRLRDLLRRKRIDDDWRGRLVSIIYHLRLTLGSHVAGERLQAEREKLFRVELDGPRDLDSSPLIFDATVYVNEECRGRVAYFITDEEIGKLHLASKSLSKYHARRRRIEENYRSFETSIRVHVERQWKLGNDVTARKNINWVETIR